MITTHSSPYQKEGKLHIIEKVEKNQECLLNCKNWTSRIQIQSSSLPQFSENPTSTHFKFMFKISECRVDGVQSWKQEMACLAQLGKLSFISRKGRRLKASNPIRLSHGISDQIPGIEVRRLFGLSARPSRIRDQCERICQAAEATYLFICSSVSVDPDLGRTRQENMNLCRTLPFPPWSCLHLHFMSCQSSPYESPNILCQVEDHLILMLREGKKKIMSEH